MLEAFAINAQSNWGVDEAARKPIVLPLGSSEPGWGDVDLRELIEAAQGSGTIDLLRFVQIALPISSKIQQMKSRFGLTIKSLSMFIGVSRQTLYDWINETHLPSAEHNETLNRLLVLSQYWHSVSNEPIGHSLVKVAKSRGVDVRELIGNPDESIEEVKEILRELAEHKDSKAQRIRALQSTSTPHELDSLFDS